MVKCSPDQRPGGPSPEVPPPKKVDVDGANEISAALEDFYNKVAPLEPEDVLDAPQTIIK